MKILVAGDFIHEMYEKPLVGAFGRLREDNKYLNFIDK